MYIIGMIVLAVIAIGFIVHMRDQRRERLELARLKIELAAFEAGDIARFPRAYREHGLGCNEIPCAESVSLNGVKYYLSRQKEYLEMLLKFEQACPSESWLPKPPESFRYGGQGLLDHASTPGVVKAFLQTRGRLEHQYAKVANDRWAWRWHMDGLGWVTASEAAAIKRCDPNWGE